MILYGMVRYDTVWYGKVQYAMVWYGTVLYCMVWYVRLGNIQYGTEVTRQQVHWDPSFLVGFMDLFTGLSPF